MASIHVTHSIGDLARDVAAVPVKFARKGPGIVKRNAIAGNKIAQGLARERSGPHGSAYWKRLSAEATGPLTWEFGPHAGGTPVGAGYRTSAPNMDLPNAADLIGPKFANDVGDAAEEAFGW